MRPSFLKKFTALLLVVTIIAASGLCSCLDSHAADKPQATSVATGCGGDAHCPACPGDDSSDADHCASSCYCSCHLPLTVQTVQIRHSPAITALVFFESFTAIPEVYLSKFIPPQIHA
jgi:hypothetical protein